MTGVVQNILFTVKSGIRIIARLENISLCFSSNRLKTVEGTCPRDSGGADSREKDVSPAHRENRGPSAAPLFLTDTSELAHSLPLVHEHEGFQGGRGCWAGDGSGIT